MKAYNKLADSLTPLAKGMNSEYCNQNTYDALQIHGGSGFMMDYPIQRYARDARITSIYEARRSCKWWPRFVFVMNGAYLAHCASWNSRSERRNERTPSACR